MNFSLVKESDMAVEHKKVDCECDVQNKECGNEETMCIKICRASEGVQELMGGFHEGVIAMLKAYGFKGFVFYHPRYNCDVNYFIKGDTVIVVDSYSNFFVAEALGEEEKKWLANNIKENPGEKN